MSDAPKTVDQALSSVSEDRRTFLKKVVVTTAFTAPVVATFAVEGILMSSSAAMAANSTVSNISNLP